MAHKIKSNLFDNITNFIEEDKLVVGTCNGCQILVNLGIVPNIEGYKREVALVENDVATYQCRWVKLKVTNNKSPWLREIKYLQSFYVFQFDLKDRLKKLNWSRDFN